MVRQLVILAPSARAPGSSKQYTRKPSLGIVAINAAKAAVTSPGVAKKSTWSCSILVMIAPNGR